jgi:hypothetical protein
MRRLSEVNFLAICVYLRSFANLILKLESLGSFLIGSTEQLQIKLNININAHPGETSL